MCSLQLGKLLLLVTLLLEPGDGDIDFNFHLSDDGVHFGKSVRGYSVRQFRRIKYKYDY